nr:amidohydrolase family protein [Trichocoleus sp. FACHB-90]
MPGVIDPQVHFREPGLEHKEDLFTASCACSKGGVTSFLEMPNTRPLTTTQAALDDKLRRAQEKCLVNYGFFIGATAEIWPDLLEAHPTPGIKIFSLWDRCTVSCWWIRIRRWSRFLHKVIA